MFEMKFIAFEEIWVCFNFWISYIFRKRCSQLHKNLNSDTIFNEIYIIWNSFLFLFGIICKTEKLNFLINWNFIFICIKWQNLLTEIYSQTEYFWIMRRKPSVKKRAQFHSDFSSWTLEWGFPLFPCFYSKLTMFVQNIFSRIFF